LLSASVAMVRVVGRPGAFPAAMDDWTAGRKTIVADASPRESRFDHLWIGVFLSRSFDYDPPPIPGSSPFSTDAKSAPPLHHHVSLDRRFDRPLCPEAACVALDRLVLPALCRDAFCSAPIVPCQPAP